ncbi:MAG: rhodanese-like domain-containing protein [Halioglobus sp.]
MLKTLPQLILETTGHVRVLDAAQASTECRERNGLLVDVREPAEAQAKSPAGSHNIPRGVIEMKISTLCPDADAKIYLHCATGGRARLAAAQLLTMGYEDVTAISCSVDDVCAVFL